MESDNEWGYITGHNSEKYTEYAEKFHFDLKSGLTGVYLNVAKARVKSDFGKIRLQIWRDNLDDSSLIFSKYYNINQFQEKQYNFIQLDDFYQVEGDFYIGYKVFYLNEQDTFALYHSAAIEGTEQNTAYAYRYDTDWVPVYNVVGRSASTSLDIKPLLNNPLDVGVEKTVVEEMPVKLYPNPCSDILTIETEMANIDKMQIFDINGRLIKVDFSTNEDYYKQIDINNLPNGIYFLKVSYEKSINYYKFIVRH